MNNATLQIAAAGCEIACIGHIHSFTTVMSGIKSSNHFNPWIDEQQKFVSIVLNKFTISVHFLYFVHGEKRSAGELLAGLSLCALNKI